MNIRVINENPWSNLFAYNMFLRPIRTGTRKLYILNGILSRRPDLKLILQ